MSLSQKYTGLVLTPWFNTAEWLHLYSLAYSDNLEKQKEALEMLKIWKMRTPILPAGVEGTLILLDALLTDEENLSQEQLAQMYSVGLMRFLNLSAANSDKQGCFKQKSAKNDIPKWLVNLRHDVAHGHQIPSVYNLKLGLNFGFMWLKEKYWEKQHSILGDYYGEKLFFDENYIVLYFKSYLTLKLKSLGISDIDSTCIEQFKDLLNKKFKNLVIHDQVLQVLEESLAAFLGIYTSGNNFNILLQNLVLPEVFLRTYIDKDYRNNETINIEFRNIWTELLNMFHKYKILPDLIRQLYKIITDVAQTEGSKKMAALWIKELLSAVAKSEGRTVYDQKEACVGIDYLLFDSHSHTYTEEMLDFQNEVLLSPNEFTKYFLEALLKFNNSSDSFTSDVMCLYKTYTSLPKSINYVGNEIFTVEHLKKEGVKLSDIDILNTPSTNIEHIKEVIQSGTSWELIKDASFLQNCPIGILPHQQQTKHPFLPVI